MIVCMIDLAYLTAQRISDVLSLPWGDVSDDEGKGGIFFHPGKTVNSTGVRLLVSMSPDLQEVLDRARGFGTVKGMTIIHGLDGRKYTYSGAYSAWRRACMRAKVKNAHIHDLRAKALTDAKAQGLDAQKLAGHATESMTAHYTKARTVEVVQPVRRKY
jgi:integrase